MDIDITFEELNDAELQPKENNMPIDQDANAEELIQEVVGVDSEMSKEELTELVRLLCKMLANLKRD